MHYGNQSNLYLKFNGRRPISIGVEASCRQGLENRRDEIAADLARRLQEEMDPNIVPSEITRESLIEGLQQSCRVLGAPISFRGAEARKIGAGGYNNKLKINFVKPYTTDDVFFGGFSFVEAKELPGNLALDQITWSGCRSEKSGKSFSPLPRKAVDRQTWCDGSCNQGFHQCGAYPATIHPLEEKIPCDRMDGQTCDQHFAHYRATALSRNKAQRNDLVKIVEHDFSRGIEPNAQPLIDLLGNWQRTIFQPVVPPTSAIQHLESLLSGSRELDISTVLKYFPTMAKNELQSKPAPDSRASSALEVISCIRIMDESPDLIHQFDLTTGSLMGHSTSSVAMMPTFFQGRQSGHPIIVACALAAMQIMATPGLPRKIKEGLADNLAAVIGALSTVEQKYRENPKSAKDRLCDEDLALAKEGHQLLAFENPSDCRFDTVKRALKGVQSDDIDKHLRVYNEPSSIDGRPNPEAKKALRSIAIQERAPCDTAITQELMQVAQQVERETEYSFARNETGFPCLWWSAEVDTDYIMNLAMRV
ncbi:unnamed protein product [Sympodiomycopsis kandeliae]